MSLTVEQLRKALKNVDGNLIIASMNFAGDSELQLFAPKRFLLVEAKEGQKFFVFNNMGTHWGEDWEQKNDNAKLKSYVDVGSSKIESL